MHACCRYAAASFIGSIASLGLPKIEALGGPRLVRPLVWLLRKGDAAGRFAAVRALMFLADEPACRHVMGGVSFVACSRGAIRRQWQVRYQRPGTAAHLAAAQA